MARKRITPAQRRALLWLANAPGDTQKANLWMIGANVEAQTVHNLQYDGLIRVVSRNWNNSIETVRITAAGREAVAIDCSTNVPFSGSQGRNDDA